MNSWRLAPVGCLRDCFHLGFIQIICFGSLFQLAVSKTCSTKTPAFPTSEAVKVVGKAGRNLG